MTRWASLGQAFLRTRSFHTPGSQSFPRPTSMLPLLWNVPESSQWSVSLPHGISQGPRLFFFFWSLFQWNVIQKSKTRDFSFYLEELEAFFGRGPIAFNSRVSEGIVSCSRADTTTPTQAPATVNLSNCLWKENAHCEGPTVPYGWLEIHCIKLIAIFQASSYCV